MLRCMYMDVIHKQCHWYCIFIAQDTILDCYISSYFQDDSIITQYTNMVHTSIVFLTRLLSFIPDIIVMHVQQLIISTFPYTCSSTKTSCVLDMNVSASDMFTITFSRWCVLVIQIKNKRGTLFYLLMIPWQLLHSVSFQPES